jgi:uncharacterized Fe-S cluster-containing radical SAM superfamily protein
MGTNPIERAKELRKTLVQGNKILVVDFSDTLEGKDTSKVIDLMPNVATGAHVFRTKVMTKEIDILASREYKLPFFDVSGKSAAEIEEFIRKSEFESPLWFKHDESFEMERVCDFNLPFTFQLAGCNFHDGSSEGGCWYCFVDDKSNNGIPGNGKALLGIDETIDSMLGARERIREFYQGAGKEISMKVLRASGGEPTIALDWILNLWRRIEERGLDFVGHIDTNLSTGPLVDYFEGEGIFEKSTLEKLSRYPIKLLVAIKGSDDQNMQSNVQSETTMEAQLYSLRKIIIAGLQVFPHIYNPNSDTLKHYLEEMDKRIENFSLRAHVSPLKIYGPTRQRLTAFAIRNGLDPEEFIRQKKTEWDGSYKKGVEIISEYLLKKFGVGYRDVTRSDVVLKVRD